MSLLLIIPQLFAEVRLVITEGADAARAITVVPFKWQGPDNPPQEIASIIAADLRNSGIFNPLTVEQLPQKPTTLSAIDANCWRALGVVAVVIGQVQPGKGDNYLISYQLVDVTAVRFTRIRPNAGTLVVVFGLVKSTPRPRRVNR